MRRSLGCVLIPILLLLGSSSAPGEVLEFVEAYFDGEAGVEGLAGAVAVSPDGSNVCPAAASDWAIAVFSWNSIDGSLTFVQVLPDGMPGIDGMFTPSAVGVSPDGKNAYLVTLFGNSLAVFRNSAVIFGDGFEAGDFSAWSGSLL